MDRHEGTPPAGPDPRASTSAAAPSTPVRRQRATTSEAVERARVKAAAAKAAAPKPQGRILRLMQGTELEQKVCVY